MEKEIQRNTAVLGLGIIGGIWANHLHVAGRLAASWNRTAKADAPCVVDTPREAAERSEYVIIVVADPAAVESVVADMAPALSARHLIIQSSTIGPADSTRIREQVVATGARYLEAPFTGSKPAAEAKKIVFYLGGDTASVELAEPLLELLSTQRLHIGSGEQACTIKLAMNLQVATLAEALCEALFLARSAGISDDTFFDCMKGNVSWSGLSALKEPKLRADDYTPQFSVKHLLKDLRLLQQHIGTLPALDTLIQQLEAVAAAGCQESDFIALARAHDGSIPDIRGS